ncbi:argininosuccinate synthase domain-containing protein [Saccharothrix yanglingensis]|uniref:argininosuccinate synthase n=1 Tax=Saccharothrix yanglingensis TaxID=659496 RepID=A0ABU0X8W3_9PSEU|nr:argininosuccinate synthase domain-containing protein [Saccharothrix yanglingensis]MDQ2588563.1 argininosuccinate synthase [Saccharothrix yanglingensis]
MNERVVLAYSGALASSVALRRLAGSGAEVIAVTVDVGRGDALATVRERALACGAAEALVVDARDEFAERYCLPALRANALHGPLLPALTRPLLAEHLVRAAERHGATAVAHDLAAADRAGVDAGVAALAPHPTVLPPDHEPPRARHDLRGRAARTGPAHSVPADTCEVVVAFDRGVPVALDGETVTAFQAIRELDLKAGRHTVRGVRQALGALALTTAHRELETATLEHETARFKRQVDRRWGELVRDGQWSSPLRHALDGFLETTRRHVTGEVRLLLHDGRATVTGLHREQAPHDHAPAGRGWGHPHDQSKRDQG